MQVGCIVEQGVVFDFFVQLQYLVIVSFVQLVVYDCLLQWVVLFLQCDNGVWVLCFEFVGVMVQQLIINYLICEYVVEVNILFVSMFEVQGWILGFMIVQFFGEFDEIECVIIYLVDVGVKIIYV